MSRKLLIGVLSGIVSLASSRVAGDPQPARLGQKVAGFTLIDPRDQRRFSLDDCKDCKAVVILFIGTECPVNNYYMPRLVELHKEYSDKGIQFVAINSNRTDPAPRVAEHARKYSLPFPVLKDPNNAVADALGARRTPEAFILDGRGIIRYQGRIDDQYGIGYQRPRPTRRDLAEALDELLAGKEVSRPATAVAGCFISRVAPPRTEGEVTFSKHVAPILQNNCQECHRPGQIGPMALLTYDDAAGWAETIREVVQDRRMPPWLADPRHGKFSNDRRLSADDRNTLLRWIELGCPKGDAADLPPPRQWPDVWGIGKPDLVVRMPEPFEVPGETPRGGIPYQHFFIDPGFKEDRWIARAEARAGSPEVVHHIIVFILPPGKTFFKDDPTHQVLCGTAPGDMPMILPQGMAKRIPAGAKLVVQMHYTPNGRAQKDQSSIGMIFAEKPPQYEVRTVAIANPLFRIPPGADNHRVEANWLVRKEARLITFMPHMHLRGKDFLYEAIYPDGKTEVLLSVPRFDFYWQAIYRLAEPVVLPVGTRIHCVAHFDNSSRNPNNPDPTRVVSWGDQTWQEMMIGWIDIASEIGK